MKNIRKLWENELKTKNQIQNKLDEIIAEYKYYRTISKNYNWEKTETFKTTCKNFENDIAIFKKWLIEF